MAQENLASVVFTAQEEADLQTAIASIATIVQGKLQFYPRRTPTVRQGKMKGSLDRQGKTANETKTQV